MKVKVKSGVGFFSLLTVVFVVLKLTGFIDWGWGWVASPFLFNCLCLVPFLATVFTALRILVAYIDIDA